MLTCIVLKGLFLLKINLSEFIFVSATLAKNNRPSAAMNNDVTMLRNSGGEARVSIQRDWLTMVRPRITNLTGLLELNFSFTL